MNKTFLLITVFCACQASFGEPSAAVENRLTWWWNDVPGFLNRQHELSLAAAASLLERFPPVPGESLERRSAFLLLDNVFHEPEASKRPAVQAFFVERTKAVTAALQKKDTIKGARIWKLYNHGFIVRTDSVTLAFDVISGRDPFVLPDAVVEDIVRECDVLFISHAHGDHADPRVVEAFVRGGKPVSAPEGLWRGESFGDQLLRLKREADTEQAVPIQGGACQVKVVNCPGHQGESTPVNVVVVVTPDGLAFAHTGDQSNIKDFDWIDTVAEKHRIDVLMPNCWTPFLPRMIAGFRPALVIPGHENELGHGIDHREPYWLDRVRLDKEAARAVIMTWGEFYEYVRSCE